MSSPSEPAWQNEPHAGSPPGPPPHRPVPELLVPDTPIVLSQHLAEVEFRGKEPRRIQYAVLTAFAVRGGLEPDLLDEVTYWIDQYWQYALFAAVAIVRECAQRSGAPIEAFVAELADRSGIEIS